MVWGESANFTTAACALFNGVNVRACPPRLALFVAARRASSATCPRRPDVTSGLLSPKIRRFLGPPLPPPNFTSSPFLFQHTNLRYWQNVLRARTWYRGLHL